MIGKSLKVLTRRQGIGSEHNGDRERSGELTRHFNLASLTFFNVACSVGSGIYILTGMASYLYSGQYVAISYLLAGVACFFSAICYAEFAARVKSSSGSTYTFVYASLGEFWAFVMGWLIFIGSLTSQAVSSLTWSSYLDAAFNNRIKNFTTKALHLEWDLPSPFNNYLDIPALAISTLLFGISLRGVRMTSMFNNVVAVLNIILLLAITVGGCVYGSVENLRVKYDKGVDGVLKGSSIVMYAFFGFESATFAIDETQNPSRTVPASMLLSLIVLNFVYCGASVGLNLMQPYDQIDPHAAYPQAFKNVKFMYILVTLGPLISLTGNLVSAVYTLARMLFSMSKDGLIFKFLSRVNPTTKIPDYATLVSAILTTILIIIIDVKDLISFTDIVGFLTYSSVAMGLLIIRYCGESSSSIKISNNLRVDGIMESSVDNLDEDENLLASSSDEITSSTQHLIEPAQDHSILARIRACWPFKHKHNSILVILLIFLLNVLISGLLHKTKSQKLVLIVVLVSMNLFMSFVLSLFKQYDQSVNISFKVPLVPLLPVLVIALNTYLMMESDVNEWTIFSIVLGGGLPIYFFYGIRHSKLAGPLPTGI